MKDISNFNRNVLIQLKTLLLVLNQKEYSTNYSIILGASIGQHVRHILEFYKAIFDHSEGNQVCYDKRKRDVLLENSLPAAFEYIEDLLHALHGFNLCADVQLRTEIISSRSSNPIEKSIDSNLSRELIYAVDHSIHHMAIIRIAVNYHLCHIKMENDFGVAPSTVAYREKINT